MRRWLLGILCAAAIMHLQEPDAAASDVPAADAGSSRAGIENKHPAAYYELAAQLLGSGEKDEAVFWFYAGQLRYRVHLTCHPDLKPDGDPALVASLSETVGPPINEHAFGDPPNLAATLDKVLAWDEATTNGFTSKGDCADAVASQRAGLGDLRQYVVDNADDIRRAREKNGLPTR